MNSSLKKSLSILLAITIIFSSAYVGLSEVDFSGIFAVSAEAASESVLTFTLNEDGESYSVTDCNATAQGELIIPATYNGLPVTTIGECAIDACENLTSVIIPDSVVSIELWAFGGCSNLAYITIGKGLEHVGTEIFLGCNGLVSISVDEGNENFSSEDGVLFNKDKTTLVLYPASKDASEYSIPDGVTYIGDNAFSDCTNLEKIKCPDSVVYIGAFAFNRCTGLTSIVLPDGITDIHQATFCFCSALTSIVIPNTVTYIWPNAFYGCDNLVATYTGTETEWEKVQIEDGNEVLSNICFSTSNCWYILGNQIGPYITYEIKDDGTIELVEFVLNGDYDSPIYLEIPETINGCTVTSIGENLFDKNGLLYSVTLPDTVTNIGMGVFHGCYNLTEVDLSENLEEISDWAFSGCMSLSSISIPDSVTKIGSCAFEETALKSINLPENLTETGEWTFSGCSNLEKVTIPSSLSNTCGGYTFAYCDNLKSVEIEDGVTQIGLGMFSECGNLESVKIPKSVTWIENYAFYGCDKLIAVYDGSKAEWENVYVGAENDVLKNVCFNNCWYILGGQTGPYITYEIKDDGSIELAKFVLNGDYDSPIYLEIPETINGHTVTSLAANLFADNGLLYSISIPDTVVSIGKEEFYNCYNLTDVKLSENITKISDFCFCYCVSLDSIIIPDNVTNIGMGAFIGCEALSFIDIGKNVTIIESSAFSICTNLTSITIADNVMRIGEGAFSGTGYYNETSNWQNGVLYIDNHLIEAETSLDGSCEIKTGTKTIADCAFVYCRSLTSITIPNSVCFIGDYVFYDCISLAEINVQEGNNSYISVDGVLFTIDKTTLVQYPATKVNTEYIIPDSVIHICTGAFYKCKNLNKITLPNNLITIGNSAFESCENISSISIPESVTSIGSMAFYECRGIEGVVVPNNVTHLGNHAFAFCSNLKSVKLGEGITTIPFRLFNNCSKLTALELPENVERIEDEAFVYCINLKSIVIPEKVTIIEEYAFDACSKLEYVFYTGTREQWEQVSIDYYGNKRLSEATIHYNAKNHTFSDWVVEQVATCTEDGLRTKSCSVCDEKLTETIVASGHSYEATNDGAIHPHTVTYVCVFCDDVWSETIVSTNCIECDFTITAIDSNSYKLVSYIGSKAEILIPSTYNGRTVTTIANSCFKGNTSITSVEIAEGVTSIGLLAFMNCTSLEKVIIPASVTSIGAQAFYGFTGTIYCTSGSTAHEYAIENNIDYVIMSITGIAGTQIDYENFVIRTGVQNSDDILDFLCVYETVLAVPTASHVVGNMEFYGTGTIITVFDGDNYIGDFTLVVEGDSNGDSVCDVLDASQVALVSNGHRTLDGAYALAADSNSDDIVDVTDYQSIVNKAVS